MQPCGDATRMMVPVTKGTTGHERAARTLDKSMLILPREKSLSMKKINAAEHEYI